MDLFPTFYFDNMHIRKPSQTDTMTHWQKKHAAVVKITKKSKIKSNHHKNNVGVWSRIYLSRDLAVSENLDMTTHTICVRLHITASALKEGPEHPSLPIDCVAGGGASFALYF